MSFTPFMPPLIWRASPLARSISLNIDPIKRALIITYPPSLGRVRALNFLYEKSTWVEKAFKNLPPLALEKKKILFHGQEIPLFCHLLPPSQTSQKKDTLSNAALLEDGLHLYAQDESEFSHALRGFLQHHAETDLRHHFHQEEARIRLFSKKLTLRNVKSRWGSCTRKGHIMLSWRLIMAPVYVQNYVMIHEICHLKYFNHSQKFWDFVDNFCPGGEKERKKSEKWLKDYGITLLSCV